MSEPKLYTRNYIDKDCAFSFSSNAAVYGPLIYDYDYQSGWISSGENDDDTTASITVTFPVAVTIDTVMLLNHNLKNPRVDVYYSGDWHIVYNPDPLSELNTVASFSSVAVTGIRVLVAQTQVADAEKVVSEFIACKLSLDVASDFSAYDVSFRQKTYEVQLADGSIHATKVLFSPNRSTKYEAKVKFDYLTLAKLESFQVIKDTGEAFIFVPESVTRPQKLYLVNWIGPFKYKFMSPYTGAGYQLEMDLKEV